MIFIRRDVCWWARLDLNQGPIGYEPTALTAELRARVEILSSIQKFIVNYHNNKFLPTCENFSFSIFSFSKRKDWIKRKLV